MEGVAGDDLCKEPGSVPSTHKNLASVCSYCCVSWEVSHLFPQKPILLGAARIVQWVQNTGCSSAGPGFNPHNPHGGSQSVAPEDFDGIACR